MRKELSLLTVLILLLSLVSGVPAVKAEGTGVTVAEDNVLIREGPGLSFNSIGKANKGDTFTVLSNQYGWLEVEGSAGNGWVAEWLVVQDAPSATESAGEGGSSGTVTENDVRIRTGPGTEHEILTTVSAGTILSTGQAEGEWISVSTSAGDGWIFNEYIQTGAAEQTDSGGTAVVLVDRLNVRSSAASDATVIGTLNQGDRVSINNEQYGWYEVQGNGVSGWVSSTYIQGQADDTITQVSQPAESEAISLSATVDQLNVRSAPSPSGDVVGSIGMNESVEIISQQGDWYEIAWEDGTTAFVAAWYVETSSSPASAGSENAGGSDSSVVTILYNGSNIRSDASVDAAVTARAQAGEQFDVISRNGDWFEVNLADGTTGFIASWIVSTDTPSVPEEVENPEEADSEQPQEVTSIDDATIVIDAGHGGRDSGAIGANQSLEKVLTLRTAEMLYHKLSGTGANVIMTRQDDRYIDLHSRVHMASQQRADAFISIHYDATDDRSIRGFTTYYYAGVDQELAAPVHSAMAEQIPLRDRGVQFGDYSVLRNNTSPAILLELGYISNPAEEAAIANDTYRDIATTGIYNGLVHYFSE